MIAATMKKLLSMLFVLSFMSLPGCSNAVSGLEKDLQQLGDSIGNSVDRLEKKFEDKDASKEKK